MKYRAVLMMCAWIALAGQAEAAATTPPACASSVFPIRIVPPLISTGSGQFNGIVTVALTVEKDGSVSKPSVVSMDLRPARPSVTGKPVGYDKATLAAVSKWTFGPVPQACSKTLPIKFEFAK